MQDNWKTTRGGIIIPASMNTEPAKPTRSGPSQTTRQKLAELRAEFASLAADRQWRAPWQKREAWAGIKA